MTLKDLTATKSISYRDRFNVPAICVLKGLIASMVDDENSLI